MRPDVQKELKLSEEQIQRIRPLTRPRRMEMPGGPEGPDGRPVPGTRDIEPPPPQRMDEQLEDILSDPQMKRLKELRLQHEGATALMRKDVADRVGLSDEDRQRLRGLVEEARERAPRPQPGEQPDPEAMRRAHEAFRAQLNEKVLASLTDAHRAKWRQLLGQPFKFDENWRPPRPGMDHPGDR